MPTDAAGAVRHLVTGGQEVAVAAGPVPREELAGQVIPAVGLQPAYRGKEIKVLGTL